METILVEHGTSISIGAVLLAILIIREIFSLLRISKRFGRIESCLKETHDKIDDLHEWHNISDPNGVKIWYNRSSLEDAIKQLSKCIQHQNEIFQGMATEFQLMRQKIDNKH